MTCTCGSVRTSSANVVGLLRQTLAVHFAAGSRHFRRVASAAGGIGKNPVRAAGVIGRADFADVLRDFVHGVLFRGFNVIRFSLRFQDNQNSAAKIHPTRGAAIPRGHTRLHDG